MGGEFRKFNYGWKTNLKIYGSVDPPKYNLKNVHVPTKFYLALRDEFSSVSKNVDLLSSLKNSLGYHVVESPNWNHMDFAFSSELGEKVYSHILSDLHKFENETRRKISIS